MMGMMKDSGVEWIGEIPEGWEVRDFKKYALICNGSDATSVEDEEGLYPIMGSGGEIGKSSAFIYNKPSVLLGRKGTIDKPIFITDPFWTIDTMFYTTIKNNNNPKYFYYLCLSIPFDIFKSGSTIPSMTARDLYTINFPYPPLSIQQKISTYLDHKCAQIDAILASIQQSIEKLKEYRQAVITQAVTKGLDPDAKMKDSGVEWIGEIPEGWEITSLRRVISNIDTGSTPAGANEIFFSDSGIPWYTPGDLGENETLQDANKYLSLQGENESKIFPKNSVLMVGIGATMGKVALSKSVCSANQQINVINCSENLEPLFLVFFLKSITDYLFKCGKFATLPIINQSETKNILIPLPPVIEQKNIISFINEKIAQIDSLISEKQKLHDKFTAYKKSLIYEYVTGKREVPDDCTE